jgi:hypothetical protein
MGPFPTWFFPSAILIGFAAGVVAGILRNR